MKTGSRALSALLSLLLAGCTQPPAMVEFKGMQFFGKSETKTASTSSSRVTAYRSQDNRSNNTPPVMLSREEQAFAKAPTHQSASVTGVDSNAIIASHDLPPPVAQAQPQAVSFPASPPAAPPAAPQPLLANTTAPAQAETTQNLLPNFSTLETYGGGTVHVVQPGETMYRISRHYQVDPAQLAQVNRVQDNHIETGQRLMIPLAPAQQAQAAPAAPKAAVTVAKAAPAPTQNLQITPVAMKAPAPAPAAPVAAPIPSAPITTAAVAPVKTGFVWPVEGDVSARFGKQADGKKNDGINITATAGTPVKATADGTVVYVGDRLQGYGHLVILRHADGWLSAYAHNADVVVKKNQQVRQGQTIAHVGASGDVDTPQLHFSLRKGREAKDPLSLLNGADTAKADIPGQSL